MSLTLSQAAETMRFRLRTKPVVRVTIPAVDKAAPITELKIVYNRKISRDEYIAFRNELQKAFKGHIALDIGFDDDSAKLIIDKLPAGYVIYSLSKVEGIKGIKLKKLKRSSGEHILICRYHISENA
jgi:hypothetical protein